MRFDGFGYDLAGSSEEFSSLTRELYSFENYQSQLGVQLEVPLGFRQELAGVRHSKLNLCRARAVLQDQEHLVSHNLGAAYVAVETAYESIELTKSRLVAAEEVVQSREVLFDRGKVLINVLLESQRRLTDAQINYFQARIDYALAIRNLHFEKGTLLPYNGVHLQEGPWSSPACQQTWYERRRWVAGKHSRYTKPQPVSLGPFDAAIDGTGVHGYAAGIDPESSEVTIQRLPQPEQLPTPAGSELRLEPLPPDSTAPEVELLYEPADDAPRSTSPQVAPNQDPFGDERLPAGEDASSPPAADTLIRRVRWLHQLGDTGAVQSAVGESSLPR